jgi:dienelactone hydrolase
VVVFNRNSWSPSTGTGGRLQSKRLVVFNRNSWSPSAGVRIYPNAYHIFDHQNLPITAGPLGTIGTNREAWADAITRVTQFLSKQLQ